MNNRLVPNSEMEYAMAAYCHPLFKTICRGNAMKCQVKEGIQAGIKIGRSNYQSDSDYYHLAVKKKKNQRVLMSERR